MVAVGILEESQDSPEIEAIYHVILRNHTWSKESNLLQKINHKLGREMRNNIIKHFKKYLPPQTQSFLTKFSATSKPGKFDEKLDENSLCLVQVKGIKNLVLVAVTAFSDEEALINFYKPVQGNDLIWTIDDKRTTQWFPRNKILASGVPADTKEEAYIEKIILRKSPIMTLKELGLR